MLTTTLLTLSTALTPLAQESSYLYYTPEGYEIQRFDCTETECVGVDGSYIGHPDNVKNVLVPIQQEHVNTRYQCEGFCYDNHGFIIGVEPK